MTHLHTLGVGEIDGLLGMCMSGLPHLGIATGSGSSFVEPQ